MPLAPLLAFVASLAFAPADSPAPAAEACVGPRAAPVVVTPRVQDGSRDPTTIALDLAARAPALAEQAAAATGAVDCRPIQVDVVMAIEGAKELDPPWHLPPWAAGAAVPDERRIVVAVTTDRRVQDRLRTLHHELVHVAVRGAAGDAAVPRWFDEGTARLLGGEHGTADLDALARARLGDRVPPLSTLSNRFPADGDAAAVAYATGTLAVTLLKERGGDDAIARVLALARGGMDFDDALAAVGGRRAWQLDRDVLAAIPLWRAFAIVAWQLDLLLILGAVFALYAGVHARARIRRAIAALKETEARATLDVALVRWTVRRRRAAF